MKRPVITLTTDFGSSYYVGQIKGVLAGLVPDANVIDLTHEIAPQGVVQGSIILQDSLPAFPDGSIHIAVVDPGVGTDRPLVLAEIGDWFVIGPDNGLLSPFANDWHLRRAVRLSDERWWRRPTSSTFHGRDIMAPVAAQIALGTPIELFGEPHTKLSDSPVPTPKLSSRRIVGEALFADRYGNVLTNIRTKDLISAFGETFHELSLQVRICCEDQFSRPFVPLVRTYGERQAKELIATISSSGRLEIGVVNGSALAALGENGNHNVTVQLSSEFTG